MAENKKYSIKDFSRQTFTSLDAKEFDSSEIVGSCFHQGSPFTDVFPAAMTGVTFTRCNLDNCNIPEGNIIAGGCHRQFKSQIDGEDWLVDKDENPVSPLKESRFDTYSLSKDPKDIQQMGKRPVTMKAEQTALEVANG